MAGITLSGTTLRCEDNANADANADGINGEYSFKDFALKDAVNCVDLVTSHQSYRGVAGIQVGDGAGTALTTLKDKNASIIFNASRTLGVSSVGQSNHTIELGTKILGPNGKPSGRDGCKVVAQAITTLRGAVRLYGCHWKQGTSNFSVTPGVVGLLGELIDCIIDSVGTVALGAAASELAEVFNLDITLTGAGASGVVTQWNVLKAQRVTIFTVSGNQCIATGGTVRVRDLILGGSPGTADLRNTGVGEWDLNDTIWTGNGPQVSSTNNYINDWRPWQRTAINGNTLAPYANLPMLVLDKNGAIVVPLTYTDAQGNLNYGTTDPVTASSIKARRIIGVTSPVWEELGPFTARYNLDGATLPQVLGHQEKFNFPRVTGAFGDQLQSINAPVPLTPLTGGSLGPEEWRPSLA